MPPGNALARSLEFPTKREPLTNRCCGLSPLGMVNRCMHSHPPKISVFLVGLKVGQVALDPWLLQFRFEDVGQSLSREGSSISMRMPSGERIHGIEPAMPNICSTRIICSGRRPVTSRRRRRPWPFARAVRPLPPGSACRSLRVTALISGCGAVGLGAIVNVRTIGAQIIALEINPYRVDLAKALGTSAVFDPRDIGLMEKVRAATGGYGVRRGSRDLQQQGARASGAGAAVGRAAGLPSSRGQVSCRSARITERVWTSSAAGIGTIRSMARKWPNASVCRAAASLSTHRFPLNNVQQAFALQESGLCGKILLLPAGDAW